MVYSFFRFTVVTLYNFTNKYSLMTYMEYPIILVQMYIFLYYVLKYKHLLGSLAVPFAALVYFLTIMGFVIEFLPREILNFLVVSSCYWRYSTHVIKLNEAAIVCLIYIVFVLLSFQGFLVIFDHLKYDPGVILTFIFLTKKKNST